MHNQNILILNVNVLVFLYLAQFVSFKKIGVRKQKTPSYIRKGSQFILVLVYILKCANALLASAILCVSSFFLKAPPSPLLAATISLASFSAMLFPFLSLL